MEARTLRQRLRAALIGMLVAACMVMATMGLLPRQGVCDSTRDYGYVYSGAKSSSVDFVRANLTNDTLLVLGSSEFSTPARLVPQVPAQTMGTHNFGMRLMLVGEAFDQCLWDTLALGALAKDGLPQSKVALIVGLGMFTDGGLDASTFSTRFSYTLYRAFCANEDIPQGLRKKVQARLVEQGVDEATVRAGLPGFPTDAINATVLDVMDDLRLRSQLGEVRNQGIPLAQGPDEEPDWDAMRWEALETAKSMSTTNTWGVEDAFYTEQLEPVLDSLAGARAGETYTNTPEYDDLELFLETCDACGIAPLIVIEPTLGPYYDHIGISAQTRANAYQRIRDIVGAHESARLADFSSHEYERYFLFDIVHFGWTGWIDAEQALYEFARKE